ncbi:MAG TPA: xanthine dehydrogenase [Firmicutes bacterium]|nr:xanthine dehydrogenase [Bacillota bacterium]HWR56762.1 XdhC family protein [Negativicutes bacterium]
MKKLYRKMAELLQNKESFAVATIFDQTGSAPRTAGAKMVVRSDGSIIGSVGGGRLEADARKLAREVLASGKLLLQPFDLAGRDAAEMDMICGGQGEILIDFISAADKYNVQIYEAAAACMERREKAWLITAFHNGRDNMGEMRQQCLVKRDGSLVGKFAGDADFLAKLVTGPAKISIHAEVLAEQRLVVEPIRQAGTVYIFGAGHVSQKIAPLSESVGFNTIVLDDRTDYANRARFPEVAEVRVIPDFQGCVPGLSVDEDSYLVIVTRGHLHDKTVLEQALRTRAGYIGMIGSRTKRDKIYQALREAGFNAGDLARVYSPIGLKIEAETPEELAVSIVGELIKVRAEQENAKGK